MKHFKKIFVLLLTPIFLSGCDILNLPNNEEETPQQSVSVPHSNQTNSSRNNNNNNANGGSKSSNAPIYFPGDSYQYNPGGPSSQQSRPGSSAPAQSSQRPTSYFPPFNPSSEVYPQSSQASYIYPESSQASYTYPQSSQAYPPSSSSEPRSSSAVAHVHVWDLSNREELAEDYALIDPAPTCTQVGYRTWYCECGQTKMETIKKLGHEWGEWTTVEYATCQQNGREIRQCSRCDALEERPIIAFQHQYGESVMVTSDAELGTISYLSETCIYDETTRITFSALDGDVYGKIKDGIPSGFMKLNTLNDYITWKINVDVPYGYDYYYGTLYQLAMMEAFSSNYNVTYAMTSTTGNHSPTYPLGNFDTKVNGASIDKSTWIDTPYSTLLAAGEDSSAFGDGFSPICLVPIGECALKTGVNEITYQRLGSYNLLVSDLVFIGQPSVHYHEASAQWSSDEFSHWHNCIAPGCPYGDYQMDNNPHHFDEGEIIKEPTCTEEGEKQLTCLDCGRKAIEVVEKLDHSYSEWSTSKIPTCTEAGEEERECFYCHNKQTRPLAKLDHNYNAGIVEMHSAGTAEGKSYPTTNSYNCALCNKSALRWSALDYDVTDSSSNIDVRETYIRFANGAVENKGGVESEGTHIIYYINVAVSTSKAGLAFYIQNSSGASPVFDKVANDASNGYSLQDGEFVDTGKRYGLKVNDVEYFLGDDMYGDQRGATGWFDWPVEFPLKAGINKIDIFAYAGYRAQLMEFQLTGLPYVTASHNHDGDNTWAYDSENHWHVCTAEGCPLPEGGVYDKAAHDFGEPYDETGCSYKVQCSVCGYVKNVTLEHTFSDYELPDISDAIPHECTVCHTMAYELIMNEPGKIKKDTNWNVAGLPSGTYEVYIRACAATTTLPETLNQRYQFGFDGSYVTPASGSYASYGLGTGADIDSAKWSNLICVVNVTSAPTSFTIHWVGSGYSAFFVAVRLIKIA